MTIFAEERGRKYESDIYDYYLQKKGGGSTSQTFMTIICRRKGEEVRVRHL